MLPWPSLTISVLCTFHYCSASASSARNRIGDRNVGATVGIIMDAVAPSLAVSACCCLWRMFELYGLLRYKGAFNGVWACRVELFAVVRQCVSPPTTSKLGVAQRKSDASTGMRVKRRSYVVLSTERSRSFEVQRQYHLGDVYDS